jgi:hypothetical protein
MAVDGSSVAKVFKFRATQGRRCDIYRMIVSISDGANWSADEFGNLGSALSNGILIQVLDVTDDSEVLDLCDGLPITLNVDWAKYCYDTSLDEFSAGTDYMKVRWTFERSGAALTMTDKMYFAMTIQDDLTGLDSFHAMLQGVYLT